MLERPPPLLGMRHVAIKCRDLPKMREFYVNVLGYRLEWEPEPEAVYLTSGYDNIALHYDAEATRETRLDHLGVIVKDETDVDAWAAHVKSHGVTLAAAPRTHRDGCRSFYAFDPEGNRIQFLWHPQLSKSVSGGA